MPLDSEAIFEAALKLPENERLALVMRLIETMSDEPAGLSVDDPCLIAELQGPVITFVSVEQGTSFAC